jgi:hypothetical protein
MDLYLELLLSKDQFQSKLKLTAGGGRRVQFSKAGLPIVSAGLVALGGKAYWYYH